MPDDRRNDRGGLDHVGVRPGEVPHDVAEHIDLFFNEGVGAVLGEPLPRLGAAQSLLGLDGELGKDLLDRQLLEVDRGMRPDLVRSRGGLQGNGGHGLLLGALSRDQENGFPKLTKCGLMIEIKDQPTPPESTYSARMVADRWTTCGQSLLVTIGMTRRLIASIGSDQLVGGVSWCQGTRE